jgi:hypothetical protein
MLARTARCSTLPGALVILSLLASGCGSSESPSVASIGTKTSAGAAKAATTGGRAVSSGSLPSQTQTQEDALKYAECMRANGVPNFPDPKAGGGFLFTAGGFDPSSPAFKAAQATCKKLLPDGGPPAAGTPTHPSAEALAQMVKIAQCMRRHDVPAFPEPRTTVPAFPASDVGEISDIDGVILVFPATLDTQSPAFTRAAATCQFPLHNR